MTKQGEPDETIPQHGTLHFVNKREPVLIEGTKLPHWSQSGCVQFVTFRLADSLPQSKLIEYKKSRDRWMTGHPRPWNESEEEEYDNVFGAAIDKWIDAGHGDCLLKDKRLRDVVAGVMANDNGRRCDIYAMVIMPNHVHVLMTPGEGHVVQTIVGAWKSVSSHKINEILNRKGAVWERESFDRMVRGADDFNRYAQYIAANPQHLPTEWFTLATCL